MPRTDAMVIERTTGSTSLIDVLDRVLDKGIVIDAYVRVSLVGIDLVTVEARIVVASMRTYLHYADAVGRVGSASPRKVAAGAAPDGQLERLLAENEMLKRTLAEAETGR